MEIPSVLCTHLSPGLGPEVEFAGGDLGTETIYNSAANENIRINVVQTLQTLFLYSSLLLIILLQAIHCCGDQLSQGRGSFPEGESALLGGLILSDIVSADVMVGDIAVVATDVVVGTGDGVVELVNIVMMFVSSLPGW